MEPSTYAVEPLPTGPPWRRWAEVGADAAARQGVFAPVYSVSFGARNRIVVAPGDSRSMTLIPEKCEGYCRGVDGRAGPNLACEGCGRAVATRMDDCGMWQTVWLEPDAVARRASGLPAGPPPDWDDLARADHRVPPVEPDGSWSRRWEAAVGVALAHLVAVTEDRPVSLPAGPVAELLGHAVGQYLPARPGARPVGPGGPEARPAEPTDPETPPAALTRPDTRSAGLVRPDTPAPEPTTPETPPIALTRPDTRPTGLTGPDTPPTEPTNPETPPAALTRPDTRPTGLTGPDTPPTEPTNPETPPAALTRPDTRPTGLTGPDTPPTEPTNPETPPAALTRPDTRPTGLTGPDTPPTEPTNPETPPAALTRPDTRPAGLAEPDTPPTEPTNPETPSIALTRPGTRPAGLVGPGARPAGPTDPEAPSVGPAGSAAWSVGLSGPDARSEGLTGSGPGSDPWSVGLAGPGIRPPQLRPDVLLVPRHPLTGAPWRPPGDEGAVVPLDSGVWAYLAHPGETSPLPATGGLPEGVLRDDYPLPPRPWYPLRPHPRAFEDTLVRLPAIRAPRLRRYREAFHRAVSPSPL
ncbi:hypothetical protein ACQ86D_12135 [Streptomyces galilaeus]